MYTCVCACVSMSLCVCVSIYNYKLAKTAHQRVILIGAIHLKCFSLQDNAIFSLILNDFVRPSFTLIVIFNNPNSRFKKTFWLGFMAYQPL